MINNKKRAMHHIGGLCACLVALCLSLMGCEHKKLVYPDMLNVRVIFDWKESKTGDMRPESMWVYLYDGENKKVGQYQVHNHAEADIKVPAGHYRVLCLNADTEKIYYRGDDNRLNFEVYTAATALVSRSTTKPPMGDAKEQPVVAVPDMVWSAQSEDMIDMEEDMTITLYPKRRVKTISFTIHNVDNLEHITAVSGAITGMSGGYNLGLEKLMPPPHTVPFDNPTIDLATSTLKGSFYSFGAWTEQQQHSFFIYATMSDGKNYYYEVDVTDQLKSGNGNNEIHIVIESVPLPEPDKGGAIDPDIDGWDPIIVEIPM